MGGWEDLGLSSTALGGHGHTGWALLNDSRNPAGLGPGPSERRQQSLSRLPHMHCAPSQYG